MSRTIRRASVLLAFAGAGCGSESLSPIESLPRALTVAEREVIQANTSFGLGLFREVYAAETAKPNVFLSPLSAHMALGMTLNGATGQTFDAMRSTLGFGGIQERDINASYEQLTPMLVGLDPRVQISIANSMWYRQGFPVRSEFTDALKRHFDAEVRGLDFASSSAPATINAWVRDKTRGRIPTIVDQIRADEVMFLINAVWFKGKWTNEFDPRETRTGTFRRADGRTVQAQFMNRNGTLAHFSNESFGAVDLPYGGGAWRMTLLLPHEGAGLSSVVNSLTPERWAQWIGSLRDGRASISLPKFKLTYETHLNDALSKMGMAVAFRPGVATFDRIAAADLFITTVKQKTFVEVNEEGTEAAAATSVGVGVVSAPPSFVFDRPFIVAIRERLSGTILFIGAVGDPTAS